MAAPRILVVTESGPALPSGMARAIVYRDSFAAKGVDVQFVSRGSSLLHRVLVSPHPSVGTLLDLGVGGALYRADHAYARINESRIVRMASSFDIVYLMKTESLELVHELRRRTRARLIFDLNDSLWLLPPPGFAQGHLQEILRTVDGVLSDNEYGLGYARRFNPQVYWVPEHTQVELFDDRRAAVSRDPSTVTLGWVGGPSTTFNLFAIWEPLEKLFAKHPHLHLRLVGVGHKRRRVLPRFERVRYSVVPFYSQSDMIEEVLKMDIGLFPLFDVGDSYARGVMKATVYMSGNAAAVCSGLGANTRLIQDGQNGMLACTREQWVEKLDHLVSDPAARRRIAEAGLRTIREQYTLEHAFARLYGALTGERPSDAAMAVDYPWGRGL